MRPNILRVSGKLAGALRTRVMRARDHSELLQLAMLYGEYRSVALADSFSDLELQEYVASQVRGIRARVVREGTIHFITSPVAAGGHTELFLNMISAHRNAGRAPVIATLQPNAPALNDERARGVDTIALRDPIDVLRFAPRGDLYLHSHPHDIASMIMADRAAHHGTHVRFVNHADHRFLFQPLENVTFLEISGLGRSISSRYRLVDSQSFIGICQPSIDPVFQWRPSSDRYFLTIARREKLRPSATANFPMFADAVTRSTKVPFEIVGQTGNEPWWSPFKANKLLHFHGTLGREAIHELLSKCYAYVDSFPFTGGTVLTTAAYVGAPIFSLQSVARGYNAVEAVRIPGVQQLRDTLEEFVQSGRLFYDREGLQQKIIEWHSGEAFDHRVNIISEAKLAPFPDWADDMPVDIERLRANLFPKIRFPFELSHVISTSERLVILSEILRRYPMIDDASAKSLFVSLIGKNGMIHSLISRLRRRLDAFPAMGRL